MKILFILLVNLFLVIKESKGQLVTVFESDTLNVYTNKDGEKLNATKCELKFASDFNDSIKVFVNKKLIFSKYLIPDSILNSSLIVEESPSIVLPLKHKNTTLTIWLVNENVRIESSIIRGYRYLYLYKLNKTITLYYRNSRIYKY
jgi:hypothetical protein